LPENLEPTCLAPAFAVVNEAHPAIAKIEPRAGTCVSSQDCLAEAVVRAPREGGALIFTPNAVP